MKRKDLRKKYHRTSGLLEANFSTIKDQTLKQDIKYHILTGKCPYTKEDCSFEKCKYGKEGIEKCPVHLGQSL